MLQFFITHEEAVSFYKKHGEIFDPYSGFDEEGRPWTEAEWIYNQMGCGRSSMGIGLVDLSPRIQDLIKRMCRKFTDRPRLVFCARKEVYPPVFQVITC